MIDQAMATKVIPIKYRKVTPGTEKGEGHSYKGIEGQACYTEKGEVIHIM